MKSNYAAYFALEKQVKTITRDSIDRHELIGQFTNQKKISLSELTEGEYRELLKWIKTTFKIIDTPEWQNTPENRMRRKIIGFFKSMHFVNPLGDVQMSRVNEWCLKYSPEKKPLNEHTKPELVKLVSQVELVYQSFIRSVNK